MVKIISIEGNIGSGKSTILHMLKSYSKQNYIFVQEPVEEWNNIRDKEGETILSHFYRDNKQYSFQFQMMAYISRLNLLRKIIKENPNAVIITERCLYTDKFVFAKLLYDNNNMTDIEYTIYNKWFNAFTDDVPINGIIYIHTNPNTCEKRIVHRNRIGETIPLEYLTTCHEYHDKWLNETTTPIIKYDGNICIDETNNLQIISNIEDSIKQLVQDSTIVQESFET